jgi:hypothetical protein
VDKHRRGPTYAAEVLTHHVLYFTIRHRESLFV